MWNEKKKLTITSPDPWWAFVYNTLWLSFLPLCSCLPAPRRSLQSVSHSSFLTTVYMLKYTWFSLHMRILFSGEIEEKRLYFKSFVWGTKAKASLILSKREQPNNQQNFLKWKYFPVQFPPLRQQTNKQTNETFFFLCIAHAISHFSLIKFPLGKEQRNLSWIGGPQAPLRSWLPSFSVHCLPLFNLSPLAPNNGLKVLSRFFYCGALRSYFQRLSPKGPQPRTLFPC